MKPSQTLHNYHYFKPPLGQFDVISLDRGTKFYDNQLTIHASPTTRAFKKITHGPQVLSKRP
jgi:hypothetical protein